MGGLLAKAGHDVTSADPWPEHVEQIRAAGLRLSGRLRRARRPVPALHLGEFGQVREPAGAGRSPGSIPPPTRYQGDARERWPS